MATPVNPPLPLDPISDETAMAVEWHQAMVTLIDAGFTDKQAFELIAMRYDGFWRSWYERLIVVGHDT